MRKGSETPMPENLTMVEQARPEVSLSEKVAAIKAAILAEKGAVEAEAVLGQLEEAEKAAGEGKADELDRMFAEAATPESQARVEKRQVMTAKAAEWLGTDYVKPEEMLRDIPFQEVEGFYEKARQAVAQRKRDAIDELVYLDSFLGKNQLVPAEDTDPEQVAARDQQLRELSGRFNEMTPEELDKAYPWVERETRALLRRTRKESQK